MTAAKPPRRAGTMQPLPHPDVQLEEELTCHR